MVRDRTDDNSNVHAHTKAGSTRNPLGTFLVAYSTLFPLAMKKNRFIFSQTSAVYVDFNQQALNYQRTECDELIDFQVRSAIDSALDIELIEGEI